MISAKVVNKQQWESSDVPILCETCLGENPYVSMQKAEWDKECKICARPFTVFRWRPGKQARVKKTEICQSCAKLKHICQTCMLDLEYNIPVQMRDTLLQTKSDMQIPQSDVNREWYADQVERDVSQGKGPDLSARAELKNHMAKLGHLQNRPYYTRNEAHICSFFVKGECKRGEACPFRHVMPSQEEKERRNTPDSFKSRYHGMNDPVANKLLTRLKVKKLNPPQDPAVKTLRFGNITQEISKQDLQGQLYGFGEILTISVNYPSRSAFVEFATRQEAETAADKLYNNFKVKDQPLTVNWRLPQSTQPDKKPLKPTAAANTVAPTPDEPHSTETAKGAVPKFQGLSQTPAYSAMNPRQFGSKKN